MSRKYLAFDLEIAKDIPEGGDWTGLRPLGISCLATQIEDEEPILWHSQQNGTPALCMTVADVQSVVNYLRQKAEEGLSLLTWNGLKFDFDILAEESHLPEACEALVASHVDMMFHVFCELGYPLGLDTASKGMGLPGKLDGMSGADAPKLWRAGQFDLVRRYAAQDVTSTIALARTCEQRRRLVWTSKRGRPMELPLANGWLDVRDAMRLPLPDTSWMDSPKPRSEFGCWMKHEVLA